MTSTILNKKFMKQTSFFIAFLAITSLSAQNLRLTTVRNAYRAADKLVKQQVEFKDPGSSGRELTWDFSMVQPLNEEYKLRYFYTDSIHNQEKICGQEHNTRYYYLQKQDSLWAIGFENATTYMEYPKPELRLRFPFAYGDTLFSRFEGAGEYCHRDSISIKGYTRIKADAIGELKLPDETVKKALRVRTLRHYTEIGRDSLEMTLDTYSWYAAGIRYPVFESVKTTLSKRGNKKDEQGESMKDTTIFSTSFYYPPEKQKTQVKTDPITEENQTADQSAASVFTEGKYMPNPVESNLYINYRLTRSAKVWFTVHNNIGVPQCSTAPQTQSEGSQSTTINMSNLITGTYSLYVHVDDMVMKQVVVKK
jgi:hypothetical protein